MVVDSSDVRGGVRKDILRNRRDVVSFSVDVNKVRVNFWKHIGTKRHMTGVMVYLEGLTTTPFTTTEVIALLHVASSANVISVR